MPSFYNTGHTNSHLRIVSPNQRNSIWLIQQMHLADIVASLISGLQADKLCQLVAARRHLASFSGCSTKRNTSMSLYSLSTDENHCVLKKLSSLPSLLTEILKVIFYLNCFHKVIEFDTGTFRWFGFWRRSERYWHFQLPLRCFSLCLFAADKA